MVPSRIRILSSGSLIPCTTPPNMKTRIEIRSRVVPKEIMIKNQLLAQTRRRKRSKKSANSCKKMLHSVVPVLKKNNILIHIRHNFHENYKPKNRSYKKTKRKRFFEKIKRRMDSCDFSFSQVWNPSSFSWN